jgi:hypothetical protein
VIAPAVAVAVVVMLTGVPPGVVLKEKDVVVGAGEDST